MNLSPKIFAHRGASHIYPENTMPAFKEAIRRGAHGLELDVQLSKDGHPVVIHDESLNRTTNGTGLVKHSTLKELKELSAGAWFHPRYSHLRIPTLDEVLLRARTSPILLNIEMKNLLIRSENLEEAIIQLVLKYDLLDRVILSSFNPQSIERAKQLHRQITTGFLYFGRLEEPWKMAREHGAEYIHPPINIITTEYVHQCWLHGLQVCPYGANRPDDISLAFQCRVDGIITMYPEKARNYVE